LADRVFVDTNVFAYADDADAPAKRKRAQAILSDLIPSGQAVISTQVLQEYFVTATRKLGLSAEQARERVEALSKIDVVVVRPELVLGAIDLHRLHGISFWGALVVKSASAAGCARVLTEDLNPGQTIDGVLVENPFQEQPGQ
jgi:predicted nucleic acid-binding protein